MWISNTPSPQPGTRSRTFMGPQERLKCDPFMDEGHVRAYIIHLSAVWVGGPLMPNITIAVSHSVDSRCGHID